MSSLRVFFFVLLLNFSPWSQGLEMASEAVQTSDGLRLWSLNFSKEFETYQVQAESRQIKYPTGIRRLHGVGLGYVFDVSPSHRLKLGYTLMDLDSEVHHRLRGLGKSGYEFRSEKFTLNLGFRQQIPSQTLSILKAEQFDLREDEVSLRLLYRFHEKVKLQASGEWGWRSDSRRRQASDLAVMYGVSPGWPWIWVGYGLYTLELSERSSAYWSPETFSSHGLRLDTSFPIYSDLSGLFAVNFNNYDEDGFTGRGHYGVAGLQWGKSSDLHVKMTWTQIRSGQSSSPWKYDGLMLTFFGPNFF